MRSLRNLQPPTSNLQPPTSNLQPPTSLRSMDGTSDIALSRALGGAPLKRPQSLAQLSLLQRCPSDASSTASAMGGMGGGTLTHGGGGQALLERGGSISRPESTEPLPPQLPLAPLSLPPASGEGPGGTMLAGTTAAAPQVSFLAGEGREPSFPMSPTESSGRGHRTSASGGDPFLLASPGGCGGGGGEAMAVGVGLRASRGGGGRGGALNLLPPRPPLHPPPPSALSPPSSSSIPASPFLPHTYERGQSSPLGSQSSNLIKNSR